MKKYQLTIVDDDDSRREGYRKSLECDFFELHFIENASSAQLEILATTGDAVLLDIDLENWTNQTNRGELFGHITEKITKERPTFLVSSKWDSDNIEWVNRSRDKINIRQYLSWPHAFQIHSKSGSGSGEIFLFNPLRENLKKELDECYKRESLIIDKNETIRILHLSDLQFGDRGFSKESVLQEGVMFRYLSEKDINIHLIALTGDVTYSGLPSEFAKAKNWLHELCKQILGGEYGSRLLLIPGNHDVNMRLNATDKYKFNFRTNCLDPLDKPEKEHHRYGFSPFREFAYSMTKNMDWFTNDNLLCFVNDRFRNWGLQFYHLNSVALQDHTSPQAVGLEEETCRSMVKLSKPPEGLVKIVLSHHGPDHFGHSRVGDSSEGWHVMQSFLEMTQADLFLHGHSHAFLSYDLNYDENSSARTIFHMTSTLSLEKPLRTGDALRGFSIIELHRQNGAVKTSGGLTIRNFQLLGKKIDEKLPEKKFDLHRP